MTTNERIFKKAISSYMSSHIGEPRPTPEVFITWIMDNLQTQIDALEKMKANWLTNEGLKELTKKELTKKAVVVVKKPTSSIKETNQ